MLALLDAIKLIAAALAWAMVWQRFPVRACCGFHASGGHPQDRHGRDAAAMVYGSPPPRWWPTEAPGTKALALLLTYGFVADLARRGLQRWALGGPRPFTGWTRGAFHLEQGLFIGWYAGLALVALHIGRRRRAWATVIGWALYAAALAASYPEVRAEALRRIYLFGVLVTLLVVIANVGAILRRRGDMPLPALCLLMISAVELALLFVGPWRFGLFGEAYAAAQVGYVVLFGALIVVQGGSLWMR